AGRRADAAAGGLRAALRSGGGRARFAPLVPSWLVRGGAAAVGLGVDDAAAPHAEVLPRAKQAEAGGELGAGDLRVPAGAEHERGDDPRRDPAAQHFDAAERAVDDALQAL